MHIVHYSPNPYPIPPVGYGGTERVVYWLVRAQHAMGLKVSVIGNPASTVEQVLPGVKLIPRHGEETLRELLPKDCDVLHLHKAPPDLETLQQHPYVLTEHSVRPPEVKLLPNAVFVSQAHARVHGRSCFVRNGVPVQDYRYSEEKDRFMLFLSRMEWPHKNARTAIDLALQLKVPLKMSGKYPPWIRPKLWGDWCRHPLAVMRYVQRLGYIDGEQKLQLLARAPFLFHAVNWHEPGAIAVLEALASGTPVLATPNGSLAEFVEHEQTGLIVHNYQEALDASRRLLDLTAQEHREWAQRCRERVARIEDTVKGYLKLYERVMAGETLSTPDERRPDTPRPIITVQKGA